MQMITAMLSGSALTGCASGGPPVSQGPARSQRDGDDAEQTQPNRPVPREIRAENLFLAVAMAPGVDIREYGFKRAVMLPAKAFVDADGVSVKSRMERALAERIADTGEQPFVGPIILDMEGPKYVGGLKTSDPQSYASAARRMNAATMDLLSIRPNALLSIYNSPFVHRRREDYEVARRASQRLHGLNCFNPSLYDVRPTRDAVEQKKAATAQRVVEFACQTAQELGVRYVFPMLHHRYKAGSGERDHSLQVIEKEDFLRNQVIAARDGGAHGLVLWHADLLRMRIADKPSRAGNERKARAAQRRYSDVTMAELAETHRNVLQWTAEAFLSDE